MQRLHLPDDLGPTWIPYSISYLPIYLPTYLSIYLSTVRRLHLPDDLGPTWKHLSIYLSTYLQCEGSTCQTTWDPPGNLIVFHIYLSIYLSTYLSIYLQCEGSTCQTTWDPPGYLIVLHIYLSIYLPAYLSIYLSFFLSIYLSTVRRLHLPDDLGPWNYLATLHRKFFSAASICCPPRVLSHKVPRHMSCLDYVTQMVRHILSKIF